MNQHKIYEHLDKCKVSLILGDAEHLDNVVTFRLYEILASNSLAGIQIEYDPKRELIQDPELRDLLYIESQDDVVRLVEAYSDRLILLQKAELTRIFAEDNSLQQMKSLIIK